MTGGLIAGDQKTSRSLTMRQERREVAASHDKGAVVMRYVLVLLVMFVCWDARADDLVEPKVDFTATAVHETGAYRQTETIHYTPGKLRIDQGKGFSSTILDLKTQTQCLLMANHTYLVLPMDDELFRRFIARTPAMSGAHKMGRARMQGLETTKYAFGDDGALEAAGYYWVTDTGIMVRREYNDGVFGKDVHHVEYLTDISVGKQPAELFVVPAGYRRTK
jgi:hypothetical protein